MPSHYFSPSYRGAPLTPSEAGETVYRSRKMEGTLGGAFNVLLAGERASGTAIYGARKAMGFGEIGWIEKAEPGTYGYRRISPSEALGLKGYDDKFWTARGIASLAVDIVLDPTTYIGVGLVGKGAKVASMAGRSIRVGERGAKFIAATQARGISRATAERKLIEYMGRDPKVQAEMMERLGPSAVKFMGKPIMKTSRVTGPAGEMWRAAPMLETRTLIAEDLKTRFQVFHRLKRQVGKGAEKPFEEYYRATGVGRTKWDREIGRMTKGVPTEWHAPMVRYLELGETPAIHPTEIISLAKKYQKMTRGMAEAEVSAGILKPGTVMEHYYARMPTEAAMRYTERKMGKEFGAGLTREETVSAYIRTLGAAHQRAIKGDIFAAEKYMTAETGVKNWYVMDPFESLQRRGTSSIMSLESARLLGTIKEEMGIKVAAETKPVYTPSRIDKMVGERVAEYQMKHPLYTTKKRLLAGADYMPEIETYYAERLARGRMEAIAIERTAGWMPHERLMQLTDETRKLLVSGKTFGVDVEKAMLPLRKYVDAERKGLFDFKYKTAQRHLNDIEKTISNYKLLSDDTPAREAWIKAHKGELAAIPVMPGAPEALGLYTKTRIGEILNELTLLPAAKHVGVPRYTKRAFARMDKEMFMRETEFIKESGRIPPFRPATQEVRRAYTPGEIAKVSAPIRKELEGMVTKVSPEKTMWQGDIFYKLKGKHYIPGEALAEYTRRVPTTGWGSRLETRFKKTLTSIWPAFHARNLYGMALWQNVLAGVDPRAYSMNLDIMRKTSPFMAKHMPWAVGDVGKMYDIPFMGKRTAAQLRDVAEKSEVYGITGMVDVAATYTTKGGGGIERMLARAYEQIPQEAMVGVESIGRGALFWDRIMKGAPVEKAMKDVERFHFRYGPGGMTEFESGVMRHGFLFYRWMRGNVPLQAQMSIEKPYMYAGLGKIQERAHTPEERARLQGWQKERFGFSSGGKFMSLDLPFYEHPALLFNPSNWEDLGFALSPAIKYPLGLMFGRELATGAPINTWGARGKYAAAQFMGRGVYAKRELEKTWTGERPVSWTALHQLGGIGIYNVPPATPYTGMTTMPRMPSGIKAMGMTQENWTEYQMARGWTPRLTRESRAEIYQQHGGTCSVCGKPCNPEHPCTSQLVVPIEMGGSYSPANTVLVCSACSGTYRRTISPLMQAQQENLQVPAEYQMSYTDKDKVWGVIDDYMNQASLVE